MVGVTVNIFLLLQLAGGTPSVRTMISLRSKANLADKKKKPPRRGQVERDVLPRRMTRTVARTMRYESILAADPRHSPWQTHLSQTWPDEKCFSSRRAAIVFTEGVAPYSFAMAKQKCFLFPAEI